MNRCQYRTAHGVDLDILKMHLPTKMKFVGRGFQKLEPEQDRQKTHRHTESQTDATECITTRHSRVLIKCKGFYMVKLFDDTLRRFVQSTREG